MEASQTVVILRCLADGVDPYTGEVYPDDSPYQNVEVTRALYLALNALEQSPSIEIQAAPKQERKLPDNAGKPWSAEQDTLLCQQFDSGLPTKEMMELHQRTRGSIAARLVRLGRIVERNALETSLKSNRQSASFHVDAPKFAPERDTDTVERGIANVPEYEPNLSEYDIHQETAAELRARLASFEN